MHEEIATQHRVSMFLACIAGLLQPPVRMPSALREDSLVSAHVSQVELLHVSEVMHACRPEGLKASGNLGAVRRAEHVQLLMQ